MSSFYGNNSLTRVKGAVFSFAARHEELVKAALVDFVDNEKRHEAALVAAFRHGLVNGECKVCDSPHIFRYLFSIEHT